MPVRPKESQPDEQRQRHAVTQPGCSTEPLELKGRRTHGHERSVESREMVRDTLADAGTIQRASILAFCDHRNVMRGDQRTRLRIAVLAQDETEDA